MIMGFEAIDVYISLTLIIVLKKEKVQYFFSDIYRENIGNMRILGLVIEIQIMT